MIVAGARGTEGGVGDLRIQMKLDRLARHDGEHVSGPAEFDAGTSR